MFNKFRITQFLGALSLAAVAVFWGCKEEETIPKPTTSFTYSIDADTGGIVTFTNTSKNADSYQWDFGDGTFSTLKDPVKTYMEDGDYTVSLVATNLGGSAEAKETISIELKVIITDDEAPVITLIGEASKEIKIGESFTDPGASANDNVDGDITANIVVTGTVNNMNPGEYVLAYNVSDAAGNAATEVKRTVKVTFDDGLLTNGDFQAGATGWIGNGLDVREDGGNKFSFSNVTVAGNPFDVNVSQVLPLRSGNKYRLSFNSSTDKAAGRKIIAGIGLNEAPWTNVTQEFTITQTVQRFTAEFVANFDNDNSRVIFDLGADVGVVILDNVSLELLESNTSKLPFNFEDGKEVFSVFNGAAFEVATDPANASNKAGKITNSGAQWEGVAFAMGTAVNFATDKVITMRFNSSKADVPVLLKFENGTADPVETVATATTTGWQDLTFNFGSASASYSTMVIFVDGPGNTAGAFYVDDITQKSDGGSGGTGGCSGTPVAATAFPVTFETCETFLSTFAADGSITAQLAANPSKTGINTSNNSLKVVKATGTNRWAGFQNPFASNIDATKTLKLKVFSSKANVVMRFELNSDPQPPGSGNPPPQFRTVAEANKWVEVEVKFTNIPSSNTGLNQLVIKPDNPDGSDGTLTTSTETYYFDDMVLVDEGNGGGNGGTPGENLATNGNFETGNDTGWVLFQNGGTAALDNTVNNGGSWSGKLATGGPSNPAFKQERIGAGVVKAGDEIQVSFDYKGAVVQPGAVFNVLLFGEGAGGASFTHVFSPAPVPGTNWTTFTGTYTIAAGTDVSEGISFLIEAVCGGDAGCSVSANIDNVSVSVLIP
jgi:PKD repeat protein